MSGTGRCRSRIGVSMEGVKEVLGLWTSDNQGTKLWLKVLTEMKNRGVLKGFPRPEAKHAAALVRG